MKVFQHSHVCFHNGLKVGFCFEYGNQRCHRHQRSLVYKVTLFFSKGLDQNPNKKKLYEFLKSCTNSFKFIIKDHARH